MHTLPTFCFCIFSLRASMTSLRSIEVVGAQCIRELLLLVVPVTTQHDEVNSAVPPFRPYSYEWGPVNYSTRLSFVSLSFVLQCRCYSQHRLNSTVVSVSPVGSLAWSATCHSAACLEGHGPITLVGFLVRRPASLRRSRIRTSSTRTTSCPRFIED